MIKVHNCSTGRSDVKIVKEDNAINIVRSVEGSFSEAMIRNITFCPFCGVNLKEIRG